MQVLLRERHLMFATVRCAGVGGDARVVGRDASMVDIDRVLRPGDGRCRLIDAVLALVDGVLRFGLGVAVEVLERLLAGLAVVLVHLLVVLETREALALHRPRGDLRRSGRDDEADDLVLDRARDADFAGVALRGVLDASLVKVLVTDTTLPLMNSLRKVFISPACCSKPMPA